MLSNASTAMDGFSDSGKAMRSREAGSTSGAQGCHQDTPPTATTTFEVRYEPDNPLRDHRRLKREWCACGQDHSVPIGRLIFTSGAFRVDRVFSVICGRRILGWICSFLPGRSP